MGCAVDIEALSLLWGFLFFFLVSHFLPLGSHDRKELLAKLSHCEASVGRQLT